MVTWCHGIQRIGLAVQRLVDWDKLLGLCTTAALSWPQEIKLGLEADLEMKPKTMLKIVHEVGQS